MNDKIMKRGLATVERNHCRCHPETCCCADYKVMVDGECVSKGWYNDCNRLAEMLNAGITVEEEKDILAEMDEVLSQNYDTRILAKFLEDNASEIRTALELQLQSPDGLKAALLNENAVLRDRLNTLISAMNYIIDDERIIPRFTSEAKRFIQDAIKAAKQENI